MQTTEIQDLQAALRNIDGAGDRLRAYQGDDPVTLDRLASEYVMAKGAVADSYQAIDRADLVYLGDVEDAQDARKEQEQEEKERTEAAAERRRKRAEESNADEPTPDDTENAQGNDPAAIA